MFYFFEISTYILFQSFKQEKNFNAIKSSVIFFIFSMFENGIKIWISAK